MSQATATTSRICGFCRTQAHHLCPHAVENGDHGLWFCGCAEPDCGGKMVTCLRCKHGGQGEVNETTRLCIDQDACAGRVQARRDADPVYRQIIEVRKHMSENQTQTADKPARTRQPAKPKVGACEHCGEATKGGKFLPGHDAAYVSERVEAVASGNRKEAEARSEVAKVSETLAAKFDKSLRLRREKAEKAKKAAEPKADKA